MTRRWSVLACGAILAAGACVPPPVGAPTVSIADATAVEGGEGLTFVASLSAATTTDVSFTVALGGSAQWIADYRTLPLGVVTIPAGSTTADIAVDVVDDDTNEPVETVTIEAGGISGATIGRGRATGLVYDDDNAGPEAFGLDVLHINDHHSHLQQESVTLSLPAKQLDGRHPGVVEHAEVREDRPQRPDERRRLELEDPHLPLGEPELHQRGRHVNEVLALGLVQPHPHRRGDRDAATSPGENLHQPRPGVLHQTHLVVRHVLVRQ